LDRGGKIVIHRIGKSSIGYGPPNRGPNFKAERFPREWNYEETIDLILAH